jgi:hypothetical protein
LPVAVGPLNIDLDERAGQLFGFPRRGGLAGAQANDDVLPAHRLPGPKRHRLRDPVALVEDADDGHALSHGRDAGLIDARRRSGVRDHRSGRVLLVLPAPASGQGKRDQGQCGSASLHVYSGIQGS